MSNKNNYIFLYLFEEIQKYGIALQFHTQYLNNHFKPKNTKQYKKKIFSIFNNLKCNLLNLNDLQN